VIPTHNLITHEPKERRKREEREKVDLPILSPFKYNGMNIAFQEITCAEHHNFMTVCIM
jgi:hypothetical protein